MKSFLVLFICVALFQFSLADNPKETGNKARCDLASTDGTFIGRIEFSEVKVNDVLAVSIQANLKEISLADGPKGFHIHQFGKTSNNCVDAGPHFNPHSMQHGSPLDHTNRHDGDLGNVYVQNKEARVNILDSRLKLTNIETDKDGIVGRAIVLHEKEDDLGRGNASDSKATGNAGSRYACCIINPV